MFFFEIIDCLLQHFVFFNNSWRLGRCKSLSNCIIVFLLRLHMPQRMVWIQLHVSWARIFPCLKHIFCSLIRTYWDRWNSIMLDCLWSCNCLVLVAQCFANLIQSCLDCCKSRIYVFLSVLFLTSIATSYILTFISKLINLFL